MPSMFGEGKRGKKKQARATYVPLEGTDGKMIYGDDKIAKVPPVYRGEAAPLTPLVPAIIAPAEPTASPSTQTPPMSTCSITVNARQCCLCMHVSFDLCNAVGAQEDTVIQMDQPAPPPRL